LGWVVAILNHISNVITLSKSRTQSNFQPVLLQLGWAELEADGGGNRGDGLHVQRGYSATRRVSNGKGDNGIGGLVGDEEEGEGGVESDEARHVAATRCVPHGLGRIQPSHQRDGRYNIQTTNRTEDVMTSLDEFGGREVGGHGHARRQERYRLRHRLQLSIRPKHTDGSRVYRQEERGER